MKCNHCGAETADDSTFCESCGKKVTINKTTKPSKPWWKRKWVIITSSIVILAAIVITIIRIRLNGQENFIFSCMYYYKSQPIVNSDYSKGGDGGALWRDYWGKGQYFLYHDDVYGNMIVRMKSSSSKSHDDVVSFPVSTQVIFNKVEYSAPFVFATKADDGTSEVKYYLLSDGEPPREIGTGDIDHLWGMGSEMYEGYAYNYDMYGEDGSISCWDSTIFACALQPVKKNGKWGYIDTCGNEVIQCKFEDAYPFEYGMAVVAENDHTGDNPAWYLIDKNGNHLFFLGYGKTADNFKGFSANGKQQWFSYGLLPVFSGIGGKGGYINRKGELVIPYKYDKVLPFCYGLAGVRDKLDGRDDYDCLYIDVNDNEIIPEVRPAFRECSNFFRNDNNGRIQANVWDFFGRVYLIDLETKQWTQIN